METIWFLTACSLVSKSLNSPLLQLFDYFDMCCSILLEPSSRRLIDFARNPFSGFPTGYKTVIVHMMKFLMALYILVLFLLPPFSLTCPKKFSWRHIDSFISIQPWSSFCTTSQNRRDVTLWQAWMRAGVFLHAQVNLRGIPLVAKTDS